MRWKDMCLEKTNTWLTRDTAMVPAQVQEIAWKSQGWLHHYYTTLSVPSQDMVFSDHQNFNIMGQFKSLWKWIDDHLGNNFRTWHKRGFWPSLPLPEQWRQQGSPSRQRSRSCRNPDLGEAPNDTRFLANWFDGPKSQDIPGRKKCCKSHPVEVE